MSWLLESLEKESMDLMEKMSYPLNEGQIQSVIDFAYRCDSLYRCLPFNELCSMRSMIKHWGELIRMTKGKPPYFPNLHGRGQV